MPTDIHTCFCGCRGVGRDLLVFGASVVVIRFVLFAMGQEGAAAPPAVA